MQRKVRLVTNGSGGTPQATSNHIISGTKSPGINAVHIKIEGERLITFSDDARLIQAKL